MCKNNFSQFQIDALFNILTWRNLVTSVMTALKTNSSFSLSNQPSFVIRENRVTRPWKYQSQDNKSATQTRKQERDANSGLNQLCMWAYPKPLSIINSMHPTVITYDHHLNNKLWQFWLGPQICEHIVSDVSSLLQRQTARRAGGSVLNMSTRSI